MPTIKRTDEFSDWLRNLRDRRAKAKILARIDRLALGNPGDVAPVGGGISEMRVHEGAGYRIYYVAPRARRSLFSFAGAIKGSQPGDIALAKKIASELEV
ncbi:type II toxin-antitoxin system RelE/ParE family toxin [Bradyrhizobium sp.]|uniref:type II toxin-antitoxin system RelE/ParE family toxin n=1 Tax=Bradyrhizobium sp. TaxID=376 RepID=UPI0007C8FE18|nr:type II toxin-antitoxin system RelE/ParE family toxin [Bradyrhizobium sp.]